MSSAPNRVHGLRVAKLDPEGGRPVLPDYLCRKTGSGLLRQKLPSIASGIAYEQFGGQAVVVNLETGDCYRLDHFSSFVLMLCDGEKTVASTRQEVVASFCWEPQLARARLEAALAELERAGLTQ